MVEELTRTVKLSLQPIKKQEKQLDETIQQSKRVAQYIADTAWYGYDYIQTTKTTLHEHTYHHARKSTNLPSAIIQTSRDQAINAIKAGVEKIKNNEKTTKPHFQSNILNLDNRCITYNQKSATITTNQGRIKIDYKLPNKKNTPQDKYYHSKEWEKKQAQVKKEKDDYYLLVTVRKEIKSDQAEDHKVLGVDLNARGSIAVTNTGKYYNIEHINHYRRELEKHRRSLQSHGGNEAHKTIQRLGEKETTRTNQYLHTVSKAIIQEALVKNKNTIALENLNGISDILSSELDNWCFDKLKNYIEYKAKEHGLTVEIINPEDTSKTCSKCQGKNTTRSENRLECKDCGYENHADYNAAKNIARSASDH